jgi:hypothetical protein
MSVRVWAAIVCVVALSIGVAVPAQAKPQKETIRYEVVNFAGATDLSLTASNFPVCSPGADVIADGKVFGGFQAVPDDVSVRGRIILEKDDVFGSLKITGRVPERFNQSGTRTTDESCMTDPPPIITDCTSQVFGIPQYRLEFDAKGSRATVTPLVFFGEEQVFAPRFECGQTFGAISAPSFHLLSDPVGETACSDRKLPLKRLEREKINIRFQCSLETEPFRITTFTGAYAATFTGSVTLEQKD